MLTPKKMSKYEALMEDKRFQCRLALIPTSIKEEYADYVSEEPVLVSRELIVGKDEEARVVLGVEYAPNGEAISAYTTDANGNKMVIEQVGYDKADINLPDRISEHLLHARDALGQEGTGVAKEVSLKPRKKAKEVVLNPASGRVVMNRGSRSA